MPKRMKEKKGGGRKACDGGCGEVAHMPSEGEGAMRERHEKRREEKKKKKGRRGEKGISGPAVVVWGEWGHIMNGAATKKKSCYDTHCLSQVRNAEVQSRGRRGRVMRRGSEQGARRSEDRVECCGGNA